MLNKQALQTLLGLDLPGGFSSVTVYAEQKTARLDYVCGFIFGGVLNVRYKIISDTEAFDKSQELKINYSNQEIKDVFQVLPAGLLSEKTIQEKKPEPLIKNDKIWFYATSAGDLSFDIFSAVFYFISRYEEWQSFEADRHGRFEAAASLLYKYKSHLKPVVDLWVMELAEGLKRFYPETKFPERKFRIISTIDVDNLYAYRSKGFIRTAGACAKDLLKGDFKNLGERMRVLQGKKKDPFDIYEEVSDLCFEHKIPLLYFFLFRTGTTYDRTVNPESGSFQAVFKSLKANHALIGIHPSYDASVKKDLMSHETKNLSKKAGEPITCSRQHFLRFDIRSTPASLIENGIELDFSMGFASAPGFRAGTSLPFYYYDFNAEKQSELLFVPFCVMDGVYTIYEHISADPALREMLALASEIKKVNGLFISVFHERSFSDHLYPGFGTLYKNLHSQLKAL